MNRAGGAVLLGAAFLLAAPTPAHAAGDVPADLLPVYQSAARDTCNMPWEVLAAVGRVESGHGRSTAPGVRSGQNYAGAMGPMQFLGPTWAAYGRDGNGDGWKDVYHPVDSIWGAANYLCANGAGDGTIDRLRNALWHYNHSNAYVDLVLRTAAGYQMTAATEPGGTASLLSAPLGVLGAAAIPTPGDLLEGIGDAMVEGVARAAANGAEWMLGAVATFVDRSTTPDVHAAWFALPLVSMRQVAVALGVPLLILGVMQSLLRRDPAEMLRRATLFPALAGIGMVAFLGITAMLLGVVDWMNARMIGTAGGPGKALQEMAAWFAESRPLPDLMMILISLLAIVAAGIIWLEMLMRNAALYVALLFMPLGLATLMWPAASGMARRLVSFIAALILFPFVIVAVLTLASAAMSGVSGTDPTPEKAGVVMAGVASLGLAAIAPYKLLGWVSMAAGAAGVAGSSNVLTNRLRSHHAQHVASRRHDNGPSDNGSAVMGASAGAPTRVATSHQSWGSRSVGRPIHRPPVSSTEVVRSEVIHHTAPQRAPVVERRETAAPAPVTAGPAAPVAVIEREGKA